MINLRKLANKLTYIVRCKSTFAHLIRKILNFAIASKKKYNENFVATGNVDIVKDMMGSECQSVITFQTYYQYLLVTKKKLKHERVLCLVESLNADNAGSKRLRISHADDIALHTVAVEELVILIRAVRNFVKSPDRPACFRQRRFYSSAKMFWWS